MHVTDQLSLVVSKSLGTNRIEKDALNEHVIQTYINIRFLVALVAVLFPVVLLAAGYLIVRPSVSILGSISAYYHTALRDLFIAVLLGVGAILYVYKGYTKFEHRVLNGAALFIVGVALLPTEAPQGVDAFTAPVLHGISAILFFICIAGVCILTSRETLKHVENETIRARFRTGYAVIAGAMVVLPAVSAIWLITAGRSTVVFWTEAVAIWVFAVYWVVKSFEMRLSTLAG